MKNPKSVIKCAKALNRIVNSIAIRTSNINSGIRSCPSSAALSGLFVKRFYSSDLSTPMDEITNTYPHLQSHEDVYKFSIEQPSEFWSTVAKQRLKWQKPFTVPYQKDTGQKFPKWFVDGQINVAENCVDRHASANPNRVALIWEKDEPGQQEKITYKELKDLVCKMGNVLLDSGVKKGDRVTIYLPTMPLAVVTMLACARIGAIHNVVFAGFSSEALASRIMDAGSETVVTSDQTIRGGKTIDLKKTVDAAVSKCPVVKRVFVIERTGSKETKWNNRDINLNQALEKSSVDCPLAIQSADDLLFLLYTSGSTGKPKGIAHSTAGYLLYSSFTHRHAFDYSPGDVFGCVADIGWITGHSYVVYGPLANGASTVLFESTPTYPDPGRYWDTVSRLKITHLYCAPTALRLLLRYGDSYPLKYDLSSLKKLGCVGEPLNQEAWYWFNDIIGQKRCDLVDTWWQTETGGVMLSPRPSAKNAPILPGMPMRPMFGIEPVLVDSQTGKPVTSKAGQGALCIKSHWPGMAATVFGDHQRFIDTYFASFDGYFFSGDEALRTEEGYYQITGRMDDVINVTGHRLGTAEVEDVLTGHPEVAEAAVVGFPHEIKGESIYSFLVLKEEVTTPHEQLIKELKFAVKEQIAGYAIPEHFLVVPGLPKTRSGKIMRRILKKIASNKYDDLGDVSTLSDPSIVKSIIKIKS